MNTDVLKVTHVKETEDTVGHLILTITLTDGTEETIGVYDMEDKEGLLEDFQHCLFAYDGDF